MTAQSGRRDGARAILEGPLGKQCDRFAVPEDEAQSFLGVPRIQRDIGVTAPAGAEDCLDRRELAFEEKTDIARTTVARREDVPRNRGRVGIELPEVDFRFALDDRNIVG